MINLEQATLTGLYNGIVVDNEDPNSQGRVLVRLAWADETEKVEAWARVARLAAGDDHGTWFPPEAGDEVLVMFLDGDPSVPCVIGSMWNGHNEPPEDNPNKKVIQTRSGARIEIDDSSREQRILLETPGGAQVELNDAEGGSVTVKDGAGNVVAMAASGVAVESTGAVTVTGSTVTVNAVTVSIDSPTLRCGPILTTGTLIANQVISAAYTPGAGNVW